ncbi:MAG TPA: thioredoxin domain-containing protein [Steroidobacteraceae bacterium]|nr:thioredoxin domain-containing protein [Steroidobacteraceae bacterium]
MTPRHRNPDGTPRYTNRLICETSPYLQKHAHNPVDWFAWGSEAFERARAEEKPIHLSVGYASCHWCSVLEEESFEDDETARLLNERFINIKVDREERPDLDRIYQIAQHLITQRSGGWPLTMFLSPEDRRPFFGGTYFPKEPRYGMPAFKDVLARVADYYAAHRAELRAQGDALMQVFDEIEPPAAPSDARLDSRPLEAARADLAAHFDRQFGGFGGAPKFPHPLTLEFLLRRWHASAAGPPDGAAPAAAPDHAALQMASLTLHRMGDGGLNDQLAGGFCRYSVDPYWMIPHFEKMLYDNGALLAAYAQAALATGEAFYARIAAATAEWVIREMQSPLGGYYSSFDADSEGHEGKYYVWDRHEIERVLSAEELAAFAPRFGIDREPNFEGRWHLHAFVSVEEIAARLGASTQQVIERIDSARRKLLAVRAQRIPPARDDKILTSWNALTIRGMAFAARALGRSDLAESASRALRFIRRTHWHDGRLLATSREGRAHLAAYLDDYAYLADAILELQQVRFAADELAFARELLDVLLEHFLDPQTGALYFTSDQHERLIHRSRSFGDDATPSGNGIAALALQRMGYVLGETRYLSAAERILRAGWTALQRHPSSHIALLLALEEYLQAPETLILRGANAEIEAWRRELVRSYAPRRIVLAIPEDAGDLPAGLAAKAPRGHAVGYLCRGSVCSEPVDSLEALLERSHAVALGTSVAAGSE